MAQKRNRKCCTNDLQPSCQLKPEARQFSAVKFARTVVDTLLPGSDGTSETRNSERKKKRKYNKDENKFKKK